MVLSVWQVVHGFGTFSESVVAGEMNLNVWLRTLTSASCVAIGGMWQPMHSLPAEFGLVVRVLLEASRCAGRSATADRGTSGTSPAAA